MKPSMVDQTATARRVRPLYKTHNEKGGGNKAEEGPFQVKHGGTQTWNAGVKSSTEIKLVRQGEKTSTPAFASFL